MRAPPHFHGFNPSVWVKNPVCADTAQPCSTSVLTPVFAPPAPRAPLAAAKTLFRWAAVFRTHPRSTKRSIFDANESAVDGVRADPAVDVTAVVPDLESSVLHRLHEVEVLGPADLAEHDLADRESGGVDGLDGAELPRLDLG